MCASWAPPPRGATLAALTAAPVELGGGTRGWSLVEPAAEDAYRQAVRSDAAAAVAATAAAARRGTPAGLT